jgi:hypothetical protein
MQWLRHAFAVDPPGPARPDEAERILVDRLCVDVIRRRLTAPALLFLEMSRPLNYLSAQALHALHPFLSVLGNAGDVDRLARFLERRGSIEYVSDRLEALDGAGGPDQASQSHHRPTSAA